jgi:hypothetical protein
MSDLIPTLEQLLLAGQERATAEIYVELPASVDRFDERLQCVDATPTVLRGRVLEDGSRVEERLPTVVRAPVVYPGSGPFRLTFPIAVGSVVMLRFTSANLSRWLAKGGVSEVQDERRHDLCSAVAYPGGHSFAGNTKPSTSVAADALCLHGPRVEVGSPNASDPVVRKSDLDAVVAKLNALITKYNVHAHASFSAPPPVLEASLTPPAGSPVLFVE